MEKITLAYCFLSSGVCMQEQFNRQNKLPAFITEEKGIPLSLRIFYVLGKSAPLFAARFSRPPHASKIPASLTACGTPGAAGNVTQTHDLLDTSLRMFVPVNLCGWMGYVAHPTPDSRELCNSCPAWGVTFRPCLAGLHQAISIHAPAWGATAKLTDT